MAIARLHATAFFLEQLLAGSTDTVDELGWVPWTPPPRAPVPCRIFCGHRQETLEDRGYTGRYLMDEAGRLDPWRDVRAELFLAQERRLLYVCGLLPKVLAAVVFLLWMFLDLALRIYF